MLLGPRAAAKTFSRIALVFPDVVDLRLVTAAEKPSFNRNKPRAGPENFQSQAESVELLS